jgi:hypothetical protein
MLLRSLLTNGMPIGQGFASQRKPLSLDVSVTAHRHFLALALAACRHGPLCGHMYFKKTPGRIAGRYPDEVREFHRTHIMDQARRISYALPNPKDSFRQAAALPYCRTD